VDGKGGRGGDALFERRSSLLSEFSMKNPFITGILSAGRQFIREIKKISTTSILAPSFQPVPRLPEALLPSATHSQRASLLGSSDLSPSPPTATTSTNDPLLPHHGSLLFEPPLLTYEHLSISLLPSFTALSSSSVSTFVVLVVVVVLPFLLLLSQRPSSTELQPGDGRSLR